MGGRYEISVDPRIKLIPGHGTWRGAEHPPTVRMYIYENQRIVADVEFDADDMIAALEGARAMGERFRP